MQEVCFVTTGLRVVLGVMLVDILKSFPRARFATFSLSLWFIGKQPLCHDDKAVKF